LGDDLDTIRIYYGAADASIAMATASVREMLAWLDTHSGGPAASIRSPAT
jgi:predicted GH43/DUF377 family glycosyl hydrolase